MKSIDAFGYFFTGTDRPLERRAFSVDHLDDDQVLVEVAGCGLCHTDLGYMTGEVRTVHELPLVLGHEISGTVVGAGAAHRELLGKLVVVPAVLPCGECELCLSGHDNICRQQKMPGNDFDGGFASHVVVPGRSLCLLPDDLNGVQLAHLSVVADAITTPYQALLRSGLKAGEVAIIIGVGGIGIYMVQHARNAGATVIAIDIDEARLESAAAQGADFTICSRDRDEREMKKAVRGLVKEKSLPRNQWRVFETSGSTGGQGLAYALLSFAGSLSVIGFTMDKITLRLSNIMAFDASLIGNWGCSPRHYPAVVADVLSGKIELKSNVEIHPLSEINDVVGLAMEHKLANRAILVPNP
ncbi:MAG: 6-hydroxycyclohex-1-ene-1-carbonyl-CoA dehydrogenase [Sphingomonadales bacterium]